MLQSPKLLYSKAVGDIFCVLLGALLPLAFAPINAYFLALIIPGLLIPLWSYPTSTKRVLWRGWLFGCGFFGVGVSWVFVSIHVYGYTPIWLAAIFTALFVAVLGLFTLAQAWTYRYLFPRCTGFAWLIGFACIWVLWEWIRSWLFSGFPWLYLGYSQMESPLAGYIPLVGIYGTSTLVIIFSALITYAILQKNKIRWFCFTGALILLITGFSLRVVEWTQPTADDKQISLIQGNIPQDQKWDTRFLQSITKTYVDLTNQHWDSSLIIWPEAALPIPLPQSAAIVDSIANQAKTHNTTVIMGMLELANKNHDYYNGVIAVGAGSGVYHKRQLVPFGEYVPFASLTRGVIEFFNLPYSNIIPGNDVQPTLLSQDWKIAPLICYEITYANLARLAAQQGNIILTISNDSWFGRSWGPQQHLQIAQFRALETGRYVIRATNTGLSAIINQRGAITAQIPAFATTVLTSRATTTTGITPIVWLGHGTILIILVLLLAVGWYKERSN